MCGVYLNGVCVCMCVCLTVLCVCVCVCVYARARMLVLMYTCMFYLYTCMHMYTFWHACAADHSGQGCVSELDKMKPFHK